MTRRDAAWHVAFMVGGFALGALYTWALWPQLCYWWPDFFCPLTLPLE